jgi:hypothetical protein
MRILVGHTRSGRTVEVPVEQGEQAEWLLDEFSDLEQRHEVYCMLAYLRAREEAGWLLTAADQGDRFLVLLEALLKDPTTQEAIKTARLGGFGETIFDDLDLGRTLVLPGLRG